MSLDSVKQFLSEYAADIQIIETTESTATVALAAQVHQVEPGQIAKTLSLKAGDKVVLLVARGDARLDNKKLRNVFGTRVKMLDLASTEALTGHPVGGVCPFGLATALDIYCDLSLQDFDTVLPAAGSINSAVRITPQRLAELTRAQWIDVTQVPQASV